MLPVVIDPKERAWWETGVLDAERNLPARTTPYRGIPDWEAPILKTRYLQGYEHMKEIMARWASIATRESED